MPVYHAPIQDMRFVLHELFDSSTITQLPGNADFTPELMDSVLEEAAKMAENVLFPLNQVGDLEGCVYENGVVRTPTGFRDAYKAFCEGGWGAMAASPEWGGQGMPIPAAMMVEEMLCSANVAFGLYPGLTHGAYVALSHAGSEEQKKTYLPNLVTGKWSGTMCLTEPHCGTDLGMLRTKAEPNADGSYSITGNKIFISAGEHDLTENIIHLVLARLPDAPRGVKGISMFVVPKFLVREDGSIGPRNGLQCTAIEHKMGIKASATCAMSFDGAKGWLVGEPNKGLAGMFKMMNTERLSVGMQGLGIAETAYQNAVTYARDRIQGRSLTGAKAPDRQADPILVHPDVRRMLLTMRAYIEGCRGLAGWVARELEILNKSTDDEAKQAADDFSSLMTPVVKAMFTDMGFEIASLAVQTYGGHGYIRDHGIEQYVRDARISMLYEGTNGIQALDLVGRKLPQDGGRLLTRFLDPVMEFIDAHADNAALEPFLPPLQQAIEHMQEATGFIMENAMSNHDEIGAASVDYLRLFGLTALAFVWARMVAIAAPKAEEEGQGQFYRAKVQTAKFFMERLLPQTGALLAAIRSGSTTMMEFEDAAF
ncbi:MAG TPA: acyl-CoA dehydrogenase C-terminal domain-containing protein [Acidiphilium sp.]|nr:MAG: acyl-CoA dehydrogenase [Acidiphilium sp. 21-60-14]OYV91150.1 MAG: acyl-CoA dehydrogenase [Acidiphilium sp. 37-60-79]OZB39939.1 MAG: acyl-CoA dehydrogenase [Acidiphilium sp. 34-60-192]HQT87026.1 acyl-CoA dehydrogenase C-terminal domain-containing protein [Acidiphilium sp.]HQU22927.1 acyl-CoA dehydrogenase C-terminal domain-containing protein [Acidiphilium sp.]